MNRTLTLLIFIPSVVLMAASVGLTALLVSAMAPEGWMEIPAGVTGGALQLCQFAFIPLGFLLLRADNLTGWLFLGIGFLLFLMSNGASVAFLEYAHQKRLAESETVLTLQTDKARTDRIADLAILAAEQDIESKSYRGRGVQTLDKAIALQNQNTSQEAGEITVPDSSPFMAFAALAGITSERARAITWWLVAFLMDVCATAGGVALALFRPVKRNATAKREQTETVSVTEQQHSVTVTETHSLTTASQTETQPNHSPDQLDLRQALIDRCYGSSLPSLRQLIATTRLRYPRVKAVLEQLESEGVVHNLGKGKGYSYNQPQP